MSSNLISPTELHQKLSHEQEAENLCIFDTRFSLQETHKGYADYLEGHISGAHFLDLDKDLSSPPQKSGEGGRHPLPNIELFEKKLQQLGLNSTSHVVIYDQSSAVFAGRLWWMLRYLGHSHVQILDGGLDAWQKSGYGLSKQVPQNKLGDFKASPQPNMVIDIHELKDKYQNDNIVLIDARGAKRYNGEVEPLDAIAGHIPGAKNVPFQNNLENGQFKSVPDLQDTYQPLIQDKEEIIVYCGSGVSANHNIIALDELGFNDNVRLYVGSWSEWSSQENAPVKTDSE